MRKGARSYRKQWTQARLKKGWSGTSKMHKCKRNYNKCRDRIVWLYRTVLSVCSSEAQFTTKHKSSAVGWSNKQIQNPKKKRERQKETRRALWPRRSEEVRICLQRKSFFPFKRTSSAGNKKEACERAEDTYTRKNEGLERKGGGGKGKAGRSDYYRIITEIS